MTVTIALLCWNQAHYVGEALQSIADQTSDDFNLCIVDNGSTDGSQEAITAAITELGLKPKLIFNESNLGIAAALNSVLEQTQDEFFVPFAADDRMLPDRISHQQKLFSTLSDDVAVLSSACQLLFEDGSLGPIINGPKVSSQLEIRRALIQGAQPAAPGVMIRTNVLRNLGGYDLDCLIEDYDTWIRIVFDLGQTIYYELTPVAQYRRHSNNYSHKTRVMAAGVAYSLTRLRNQTLSSSERSSLRTAMASHFLPPSSWSRMFEALNQNEFSKARYFALRASVEPALQFSLRVKALMVVFFPGLAVRRIRRTERLA